jgi:hypothetical protein
MESIKRLKCDSDRFQLVEIGGVRHREYKVCDIPSKFGCKKFGETEGIDKWYSNHAAGVVYIDETLYFPTY